MAIYKNGKKLTASQIKNYVKKVNNWSDEEYNKARYNIKNKLRTLEAYEAKSGKAVEPQSPVEFMYKEAKAKQRYGANYKPSVERQKIESVKGQGNIKAINKYLEGSGGEALTNIYSNSVYDAFERLIEVDETAAEIWETLQNNPVKAQQALSAYAKALHTYQNAQGKVSGGGIPFGEAMGYSIAFDYSAYL